MTAPLPAWVMASLVVHTLAANALWHGFLRHVERAHNWTSTAAWKSASLLARVAFFIGVPYLTLITGVVPPQAYALALPTAQNLMDVALPALGAFAFIATAVWFHAHSALPRYPSLVFPAARRRAQGVSFLLIDALCLQAHWAFYRAGALESLSNGLAGALGGFALVLVEYLLDPRWRHRLRQLGQFEDQALEMMLALVSALLFVVVGNFWTILLCHVLLWLGSLRLMAFLYKPLLREV